MDEPGARRYFPTLAEQDAKRVADRKDRFSKMRWIVVFLLIAIGVIAFMYWLLSMFAQMIWANVAEWWYPGGAIGATVLSISILTVVILGGSILVSPAIVNVDREHQ